MTKLTIKEWKEQGKVFQKDLETQLENAYKTYEDLASEMTVDLKANPIFAKWAKVLVKKAKTAVDTTTETPDRKLTIEELGAFIGKGSKHVDEIAANFGISKRGSAQQTRSFAKKKLVKKDKAGNVSIP